MVRRFRFAIQADDLADREAVISAAREAESLGYEEFYSYDHFGSADPFVPLLVAAGATTRLRVGTLVLNNELHHPALLARTVATADRMTGGRIVVGVGTGYARAEHDAIGIPLHPPSERVRRLEASLIALRSLLDTGASRRQGDPYRLAVDDLGVRPLQSHVPLLVGGHGRAVVAVGGRCADIFQFTGLTHGADGTPTPAGFSFETIAGRARWLTDAAGDRDEDVERSILVQRSVIGEGAAAAAEGAARDLGIGSALVEHSPFLLFGTTGEVVDRLQVLRETIGVSHVVVRDASGFAPVVRELAGH